MNVTLQITRRTSAETEPYIQKINFEWDDEAATVASALTEINKMAKKGDCTDTEGAPVSPIRWQCSCLQKKCGACAMVINGRPGLACDHKLTDNVKSVITLAPLGKFPVIADLMVNRETMFDNLKKVQSWLEETEAPNDEHSVRYRSKDLANVYQASACLQCGCCLEVCPNFYAGGAFTGAASTASLTRNIAMESGPSAKTLKKNYDVHVFEGCGKSLSCTAICPAGINIQDLMVRSNAASVWKRMFRK